MWFCPDETDYIGLFPSFCTQPKLLSVRELKQTEVSWCCTEVIFQTDASERLHLTFFVKACCKMVKCLSVCLCQLTMRQSESGWRWAHIPGSSKRPFSLSLMQQTLGLIYTEVTKLSMQTSGKGSKSWYVKLLHSQRCSRCMCFVMKKTLMLRFGGMLEDIVEALLFQRGQGERANPQQPECYNSRLLSSVTRHSTLMASLEALSAAGKQHNCSTLTPSAAQRTEQIIGVWRHTKTMWLEESPQIGPKIIF